jgi:CubicO group peptidase (beta-lactamase class C family)
MKILRSALAVLLCLSAAMSGAEGAAPSPSDAARIQRIENGLLPGILIKGKETPGMNLQERMAHYKVPGVSIAFFSGGKVQWTRAYGFADVEKKTPVTLDTLFQAASISKPISSLAMLRLVQEGKLNLDEDVNVKLKGWKVPDNEFTKDQKVTLRRIVSHSAGFTVHGFEGYRPDAPLPTLVQILDGKPPANSDSVRVVTIPGSKWSYSGGGFTVMQLLMTEVTASTFPDILSKKVLGPAGMTHSTFALPLPLSQKQHAATAYSGDGQPIPGGFHVYPEMAAAGLWTTPSGLALAAIEIQNDYAGKSNHVLSKDMAHQMLTHQKDDWGLGVGLSKSGKPLRFYHSGGNEGFRCDLQAYVDSGEGIAVMTNSDAGDALYLEIERAVAREYGWPDFKPEVKATVAIDAAKLSAYAGTYLLGLGESDPPKVTITIQEGRLQLQSAPLGPEPLELYAESETRFFSERGFGVTFNKDSSGAVTQLTVHFGGQDIEAKKVP